MKTHSLPATAWIILSAAFAVTAAAQTTPATPSSGTEEEQTVQMSPFEVTTTRNIGYQAGETLAGNRVRTNLRDVGSAISVVTEEFLHDTGATSNLTLLQYTTSTEIGGPGGNFGGLGDSSVLDDTAQRLRPNSSTRVRGLDSADNTRDFYLTEIPWDSYNITRIDIQRGANSILFGNGSGAGIINGATDTATIGKNSGTAEARYGSYGSYRASVNLNYDLIPNELAVRAAALYNKTYYQQDPAFNLDRRYYGALRWEPKFLARGSARTSLRMSYEKGQIDANRPRTSTPMDEISPWFLTSSRTMVAPTPVNVRGDTTLGTILPMNSHAGYDPFVITVNNAGVISANPTRQDIGASTTYIDRYADQVHFSGAYIVGPKPNVNSEPWITFGSNNGVNGDWQGSPAAIYLGPASSVMAGYLATRTNGTYYAINSSGARDASVGALRGPEFNGIVNFADYAATRGFLYQGSGVYRATSLSDRSFFDFYNKLIDGPNKREFSRFEAFNISLDQTFWHDRAGFQLAYDKQTYITGQDNLLGGGPTITLDIWSKLPVALVDASTGLLQAVDNPNFGRPFIASGRGTYSIEKTKREVWRLTPYLDLNFKDIFKTDNTFTKILGRNQLTGLLESNTYTRDSRSGPHNSLSEATALALWGTGRTITDSVDKIVTVVYLGPSIANGTMSGANISNITAVLQPTSGQLTYFNPTYKPSAPSPGAAYVPPALGLSASATGGAATTQSENPANYVGWSTQTPIAVSNVDINGLVANSASGVRNKTESSAIVDQWSLLNGTVVLMGGLRKDKIDTFMPGVNASGNRSVYSSYSIINFDAPFDFPTSPTLTYTSQTLKTYSIVLHSPQFINKHLPWGLNASVFYSKSDNFRPVNRIDIYGTQLAPPSGKTKDYGVLIGMFDNKLSLKITRYTTEVTGAGGDVNDNFGNNMRQRIGDEIRHAIQDAYYIRLHVSAPGYRQNNPFDPTGALSPTGAYAVTPTLHVDGSLITGSSPATQADWIKTEVDIQAAAQDALDKSLPAGSKALSGTAAMLATYNFNPSGGGFGSWVPGTALDFAYPSTLTITSDTRSTGTEYELYFQPTPKWNISVNASKTFATRTNLSSAVREWVLGRWALYTTNSNAPALQGIGDIPWFGGNQGDNAGRVNTTGLPRFGRNAWAFFNLESAQEGNAVPELRPWRVNIVTTYNFSQGSLKGMFVGGGYRWQDRNIIGYGVTEQSPQLSSGTLAVGALDPSKPFYGPTEDAVDLWVGYNTKVLNNVELRVQLNVRNVGQTTHLVPINTNPDASVASWRIATGMTWELSTTFKF